CKRCDTVFQLPGKRARPRAEKVEADTKSNPQARVETPRATPTAHGAAEPRRRWLLLLFALFACLGVLALGAGGAAYLLMQSQQPMQATVAQRVAAAPGGKASVDITVDRGSYHGTVRVSAKGLAATLQAEPLTLGADQDAAKFTVIVSPLAPEGETEMTVLVQGGEYSSEHKVKVAVEWPVGELRCLRGHKAEVTAVA